MLELNWSDRRKTYIAFRCVLHALRDHVPVTDAVQIGEQLPMLVRGFYFEHWNPAGKPLPLRSKEDFFSAIASDLTRYSEDTSTAETITRAVFRLLERKATDGEIEEVSHLMPKGLRDLWPSTLRAA